MRGGMKESSDLNARDIVSIHEEWRSWAGMAAKVYATSSRLDIWGMFLALTVGGEPKGNVTGVPSGKIDDLITTSSRVLSWAEP